MNNKTDDRRGRWANKISRRGILGVLTLVLLLAGVVVTLSMQKTAAQMAPAGGSVYKKPELQAKPNGRGLVTVNSVGQVVVLNRATGQTRFMTQDEASKMAVGLKQLINQSSKGLVEVKNEDGSISMDLQGRFQDVMLAKTDEDGNLEESCVNNLQAASEFLDIDPKLLGLAAPKARPVPTDSPENR